DGFNFDGLRAVVQVNNDSGEALLAKGDEDASADDWQVFADAVGEDRVERDRQGDVAKEGQVFSVEEEDVETKTGASFARVERARAPVPHFSSFPPCFGFPILLAFGWHFPWYWLVPVGMRIASFPKPKIANTISSARDRLKE